MFRLAQGMPVCTSANLPRQPTRDKSNSRTAAAWRSKSTNQARRRPTVFLESARLRRVSRNLGTSRERTERSKVYRPAAEIGGYSKLFTEDACCGWFQSTQNRKVFCRSRPLSAMRGASYRAAEIVQLQSLARRLRLDDLEVDFRKKDFRSHCQDTSARRENCRVEGVQIQIRSAIQCTTEADRWKSQPRF